MIECDKTRIAAMRENIKVTNYFITFNSTIW